MSTERLTDDDLAGIRDTAVPGTLFVAMATELIAHRTRAAYILSHGDAFAQAVVRGERDYLLGVTAPPARTTP